MIQTITQEEAAPITLEEETLQEIAHLEGVTIRLGIIAQIQVIILQIQITLLGMEIAAMIVRQETKEEIQVKTRAKAMKMSRLKKVRMKALKNSLRKALRKKAKKNQKK